jgi:hypothetical protein
MADVLAETQTGARRTAGGGQHLDLLKRLFDPGQRAGVGQCCQHQATDVVAVDREEVIGAAAVTCLEPVEKTPAGHIPLVVLIQPNPARKLLAPPLARRGELEGRRRVPRRHPTEILQRGIHARDTEPKTHTDDAVRLAGSQRRHRRSFVRFHLRDRNFRSNSQTGFVTRDSGGPQVLGPDERILSKAMPTVRQPS